MEMQLQNLNQEKNINDRIREMEIFELGKEIKKDA